MLVFQYLFIISIVYFIIFSIFTYITIYNSLTLIFKYAHIPKKTQHAYNQFQPSADAVAEDSRAALVIRAFHDDCGDAIDGRNCISGVRVETRGDKVTIQGDIVKINGKDLTSFIREQPYLSSTLYVKQATSKFMMIKGFGFRVLFGYRQIFISVDPFYDNKVRQKCFS